MKTTMYFFHSLTLDFPQIELSVRVKSVYVCNFNTAIDRLKIALQSRGKSDFYDQSQLEIPSFFIKRTLPFLNSIL